MPELPEVEIVRQSLLKNIKGKKINKVLVRNRNLRFKLETSFEKKLKNKLVSNIKIFSIHSLITYIFCWAIRNFFILVNKNIFCEKNKFI